MQNLGILDTDENGDGLEDDNAELDDVDEDDIADRDDFSISADGVLSFSGDDFEGQSTDTADDDEDVYHVVVQASDGGTTDDTGAPPRGYLAWFKVTVTVMDKDEEGTIALTPETLNNTDIVLLQPQVGVQITASLTDPDGGVTVGDINWKWERKSGSSQWETITGSGADSESYTPQDIAPRIDVGHLLRVTASYDDENGNGKTAMKVLDNPVLDSLVTNAPPAFPAATATRRVDENASGGTPVGAPVTAVDPDLERQGGSNRKVTYWLAGGGDNALFAIDEETGQIEVGTPQDFENPGSADNSTEYEVTVMATDSSAVNSAPGVTVTINLVDLDEAPIIALTAAADPPTLAAPVRIEHDGGFAIERAEGSAADLTVSTFSVEDDDGGTPTLTLSGTDAEQFRIGPFADAPDTAEASGTVFFKDAPNFEAPADGNSDNIYEVTIVADDGRNTHELDLTVKVTNDEEVGTVTLSYQQPLIGSELTASVIDPDGGFDPASGASRTDVTAVTWQWEVTTDKNFEADAECLGATGWDVISSAKGATFKPRTDDDRGCLRATAMYMDRTYVYPQAPSDDPEAGRGFDEMVQVVSGVVREDPANKPPALDDALRYIPEKTPGHKYVGDPVTATDSDPRVYLLGGDDMTSFYIAEEATIDVGTTTERNEAADAGQIWVGARTKLDYEGKDTYTVEVTATDTYGATDSADVTINVTDVDEAPTIVVGALAISGPPTKDYAENGTGAVDTYTAVGPHADLAGWSLEGADAGAFTFRYHQRRERYAQLQYPAGLREPGRRRRGQHLHGDPQGQRRHLYGRPGRDGDGHQRGRARDAVRSGGRHRLHRERHGSRGHLQYGRPG